MERLCTAVFWAEHSGVRPSDRNQEAQLSRLAWLIERVKSAQLVHADMVNVLLEELRYKGNGQPYPQALLKWFGALCAQQSGLLCWTTHQTMFAAVRLTAWAAATTKTISTRRMKK